MSEPTTYQTVGGATVTVGFRPDAMYGPVHFFECAGCNIEGGRKTAEFAHEAAKKHAARCAKTPAGGDHGRSPSEDFYDEILARALAEDAATEKSNTPAFGDNACARFLALGGAHVIVERLTAEGAERFTAACEACGHFDLTWLGSDAQQYRRPQEAEEIAIEHAKTCRRIPKRLWPNGGAS